MLQNVIGLISYYLSPTPVNLSDRGRGNVGKAIVSGTWIDHSIKVHRNRGNFVSGIFPFFFFRRLKERKKKKKKSRLMQSEFLMTRSTTSVSRALTRGVAHSTPSEIEKQHAFIAFWRCRSWHWSLRHACFHLHSYRPVSSRKKKRYHNCRNVTIGGTWIWMWEKKNSHALYVAGWNFNLHRNKLGIRCCAELDCFSIVRHKGERLVELRNFNRRGGKKSKKMVTRGELSMLGCT